MTLGSKLLLSAFLSSLVMWPLFLSQPRLAPVLSNPKEQVFIRGGDAWKNIYTVAFHVVHDEGYIETQSFNYPDGEHIAFADGQPLLSTLLKIVGVKKVETVFSVVQLLPFVGCVFGAVLLTWLLLRLRLPLLYAILFGIGIALLSPQMTRSTQHFGLSYVFAIPLILHLLLNWANTRSWGSVIWLVFASICLGQLHLYLLASALLLSSLFMLFSQLFSWKGSGLRVCAQISLFAILSFGITKGIIDLTWPIADRPAAPYGLKAFITPWEDVIINRGLPWWKFFNEHVVKIRQTGGFEGMGYVGILTGLFSIGLIIRYVIIRLYLLVFSKKVSTPAFQHVADEESRSTMVVLSLVALVSFVVASGYLLSLPGFEYVLENLGAVRQFRSLGRFIWIGYYSIQLVSATVITLWCLRKAERAKRLEFRTLNLFWRLAPVLFSVLLIWEGNQGLSTIFADPSPQKYDLESWVDAIGDPEKYQAVLPLPYFHVGSENYKPLARYGQAAPSTLFSLKTGLPNMGVMMSRQSGSLTRERLGLNKPWLVVPPVLNKLDEDKPILIFGQRLTMRENKDAKSAHDYAPWFAEADTVFMDDDALILKFLPSKENLKKVLDNYCDSLTRKSVFASTIESSVYQNKLQEEGWGIGESRVGITISSTKFQELHRWSRPFGDSSLMVNWLAFVGEDGYMSNQFELRVYDANTGAITAQFNANPSWNTNQFLGEWAQIKLQIPAKTKGDELALWGKMLKHPNVKDLTVRNLVCVPADTTVLWQTKEGLMKDGLLLKACY